MSTNPECLQATAAEDWGSTVRSMKTTRCAIRLMRGGFCCGVHAVLRHFVNSAQRLFLMKSVQLIQRTGAFTDRVRFFDRLRHVSLRQNPSFAQLLAARQLCQNA